MDPACGVGPLAKDAAPQDSILWYDVHCHLQDHRLTPFEPVWHAMRRAGVAMAVTNATSEQDWEAVANLAQRHPAEILPAWGVHPWFADRVVPGWEERLERRLASRPRGQVGECGLDGGRGRPPMAQQMAVFRRQIRLAGRLRRPFTIHCVRAWPALWHVLRQEPPGSGFLLHSYQGSVENAMRLAEIGGWFSFSGALLDPRRRDAAERFRLLPKERILLETDAPNMPAPVGKREHELPLDPAANHPANLAATGRALAELLGIDLSQLAAQLKANTFAFWGIGQVSDAELGG